MKKLILSFWILILSTTLQSQTLVTFYTTEGNFTVEIYDHIKPITGGNFLDLVNQKYYDGVIFHRVIDDFIIQGGDPTGTGSGGPGYSIADEFDSSLSNVRKTISMANRGPNTGGSQFFFNLTNNTHLDFDKSPFTSKHPVFGIVIENYNIVEQIGSVPVDGSDRPLTDVVMDSIRVGNGLPSGINSRSEIVSQMTVYPNPIASNSKLYFHSKRKIEAEVRINDMQGKELYRKSISIETGRNQFDLSSFLNATKYQGILNINLLIDNQLSVIKVSLL